MPAHVLRLVVGRRDHQDAHGLPLSLGERERMSAGGSAHRAGCAGGRASTWTRPARTATPRTPSTIWSTSGRRTGRVTGVPTRERGEQQDHRPHHHEQRARRPLRRRRTAGSARPGTRARRTEPVRITVRAIHDVTRTRPHRRSRVRNSRLSTTATITPASRVPSIGGSPASRANARAVVGVSASSALPGVSRLPRKVQPQPDSCTDRAKAPAPSPPASASAPEPRGPAVLALRPVHADHQDGDQRGGLDAGPGHAQQDAQQRPVRQREQQPRQQQGQHEGVVVVARDEVHAAPAG